MPSPRFQSPRTIPSPRSAPQRVAPNRAAPPNVRQYSSGAVPRYSSPRYETPRYDQRYVSPRYSPRYVAPRYVAPRYVAPYRYAQPYYYRAASPYYAFRPRLRLGFGIYIGYPVGFPSWYDPYVPGVYPYYRQGVSYGGVSFDIQPYNAAVYVDGNYVGVVNDFSPLQAPLTLPAGSHHIDVGADGFAPLSFDITVVPGQVIPYQGTLSQ
jgi:PEGA domain-containing protein